VTTFFIFCVVTFLLDRTLDISKIQGHSVQLNLVKVAFWKIQNVVDIEHFLQGCEHCDFCFLTFVLDETKLYFEGPHFYLSVSWSAYITSGKTDSNFSMTEIGSKKPFFPWKKDDITGRYNFFRVRCPRDQLNSYVRAF